MANVISLQEAVEAKLGGTLSPTERAMVEIDYGGDFELVGDKAAREAADKVLQIRELTSTSRVEPPETLPKDADLAGPEARAVATSILVALMVARDDEGVRRFRSEVLGGHLVPSDEVEKWLAKAEQAERLEDWPTDPVDRRLSLALRPAGQRHRLLELSRNLEQSYGWTVGAATRFVLSGDPPYLAPIRSKGIVRELPAASRVVLTVDPNVSPGELIKEWRIVQGRFRKRSPKPLLLKHLTLAVWVAEQEEDLSWRELMGRWNREHEKWAYTSDSPTNFARDVRHAQERLLYGKVGIPETWLS